MTSGFAPPGGADPSNTPADNTHSNRADAPLTRAGASSGRGAGLGTGSAGAGSSGTRPSGTRPSGAPRTMFQAGPRVAMAAWIAIAAGVALLIGISWSAALAWSDDTLSFAKVGDTGPMSAAQVVQGMCLASVGGDGSVHDVEVVRCDEPHRAEIFTKKTFELAKYPGTDHVTSQALDYCTDRLTGLLPEGSSWVAWTPSEQSWSRGDRTALCIAVFDEPKSEPLSPAGIKGIGADEPIHDGLDA